MIRLGIYHFVFLLRRQLNIHAATEVKSPKAVFFFIELLPESKWVSNIDLYLARPIRYHIYSLVSKFTDRRRCYIFFNADFLCDSIPIKRDGLHIIYIYRSEHINGERSCRIIYLVNFRLLYIELQFLAIT